jgi:hypothetical protein
MTVSGSQRQLYRGKWAMLVCAAKACADAPAASSSDLRDLLKETPSRWIAPTDEAADGFSCEALIALARAFHRNKAPVRAALAPALRICADVVQRILGPSVAPLPSAPPRHRVDLDGPADE